MTSLRQGWTPPPSLAFAVKRDTTVLSRCFATFLTGPLPRKVCSLCVSCNARGKMSFSPSKLFSAIRRRLAVVGFRIRLKDSDHSEAVLGLTSFTWRCCTLVFVCPTTSPFSNFPWTVVCLSALVGSGDGTWNQVALLQGVETGLGYNRISLPSVRFDTSVELHGMCNSSAAVVTCVGIGDERCGGSGASHSWLRIALLTVGLCSRATRERTSSLLICGNLSVRQKTVPRRVTQIEMRGWGGGSGGSTRSGPWWDLAWCSHPI